MEIDQQSNKKWAEKLFEDHRNTHAKLDLPGTKFFIPTKTKEESEIVGNNLNKFAAVLQLDRVERRCARCVADFLEKEDKIKVRKIVGQLMVYFGHQNRNGVFLSKEEAVFLMEMNRLEIFWNSCTMSVKQAYDVFLSKKNALQNYKVYRKLAVIGFKLVKSKDETRKENIDDDSSSAKKQKLNLGEDPDYIIYPPNDITEESKLNLFVGKSCAMDSYFKHVENSSSNIVSLPLNDSPALYNISYVDLPIL